MEYKKISIVAASVAAIVALLWFRHIQTKHDMAVNSPVLSQDVREKIVINPLQHTIAVVTKGSVSVTTLPTRPSSIELLTNGTLRVIAPQYGFEAVPFIGLGFSRSLNDYIGCDFWYWKRLDVGAAVGFDRLSLDKASIGVMTSFTVWHNTRLTLGVDTAGHVHGLVSVRL